MTMPTNPATDEGLVERLLATAFDDDSIRAPYRRLVNPDGPEAATRITEMAEEIRVLRKAVMAVVQATRAHLPPDGLDAKECISLVIGATDNPTINPIIAEIERGH